MSNKILNKLLRKAAVRGWNRTTKVLIKRGADINGVTFIGKDKGKTPLILAIASGNMKTAQLLIKSGADINLPILTGGLEGFTPLLFAAINTQWGIVELLINQGADFNLAANEVSLFTIVAAESKLDMAKLLIAKGLDINAEITNSDSYKGYTLLMIAIAEQNLDVIEFLIMLGADLNSAVTTGSEKGFTPLLVAVHLNNIDAIELLVKNGADINAPATEGAYAGLTPLLKATLQGDIKLLKELIANGADINAIAKFGYDQGVPAFVLALEKENLELFKFLIENGANIDIAVTVPDFQGLSLLGVSVEEGNLDKIKFLIENGANVNLVATAGPYEGINPLQRAIHLGDTDIIELLINKGAVININDLVKMPSLGLSIIAKYAEKDAKTSENTQNVAVAILCRKILLERELKTPEVDNHDVSYAISESDKVKKHFVEHKIKSPSYTEAIVAIRDCIIERIKAEVDPPTTDDFKKFLNDHKSSMAINIDELSKHIDTLDSNHRALEWLMTFESRMIYRNDPVMELVKEMLVQIVACRNDLINKPNQSKEIEDSLILQLHNAMDANEGTMSCAPGTPRFLRVVLEVYIMFVKPDASKIQYKQLQQSICNVIDNLMRAQFKLLLEHKDISDQNAINKLKGNMANICESLTTIGADNANKIIDDEELKGKFTDEPIDAKHLKLRKHIMYKTYPEYESFKEAVVANMQSTPHEKIQFSLQEEDYLHLMYVAISNETIREKLYKNLGDAQKMLNVERAIFQAPAELSKAVALYQSDKLKNLRGLKETLNRQINMLIGERTNLETRDNVVDGIISNITAKFDPVETFNTLKQKYDQETLRLIKMKKTKDIDNQH